MRAAVRRYELPLWEVWNEPNVAHFAQPHDPYWFSEIARETSEAMKAERPDLRTVLAGCPVGRPGSGYREYLRELYEEHRAHVPFDAVGVHPYAHDEEAVAEQVGWVAERTGEKKLWATEFGWGVDGKPSSAGRGSHRVVTEEEQAALLKRSYRNMRDLPELRVCGANWHSSHDFPDGDGRMPLWVNWCGLITIDGRRRQAFDAARRVIGESAAPSGRHAPEDEEG